MHEAREPARAARADPEAALAAELRDETLTGEEEALQPAELGHVVLEAAGEADDVAARAHVDGVDAAVRREHERALAHALQEEEAGAAEEALRAAPLRVHLHARPGREERARVQEDRERAVQLDRLDVALRRRRD